MQLLQIQNQNISAKVDSNFAHLANYVWHIATDGQVVRYESLGAINRTIRLIDHIVLPSDGLIVSHKSNDFTDCRSSNLRISFDLVIEQAAEPVATKTSESVTATYKGVKKGYKGKFNASFRIGGTIKYLGSFDDARFAARVVDSHNFRNTGNLNGLNLPDELDETLADLDFRRPKKRTPVADVKKDFRGVTFDKRTGKFRAFYFSAAGSKYIGIFHDQVLAAKVVDSFHFKESRDRTLLNFPDELDQSLAELNWRVRHSSKRSPLAKVLKEKRKK